MTTLLHTFIAAFESMENFSFLMIPAHRDAEFNERFTTIVKKAKKLGVATPECVVISDPTETREYSRTYQDSEGIWKTDYFTLAVKVYAVSGLRPRIQGQYQFVARCEHTPGGIVVTQPQIEGMEAPKVPEEFLTRKPVCDHCNTARARKLTYVVQDMETGKYLSIGSSCLKDFFGEKGIKELLWSAENLDKALGGCAGVSDDNYDFTVDYLAACLMAIDAADGQFRPSSFDKSTKSEASQLLFMSQRRKFNIIQERAFAGFREKAVILRQEALELLQSKDVRSEYEHNLLVVTKSDLVVARAATGLLASLQKYVHGNVPKPEKKISQYVGAVGDKYQGELTLSRVFGFDTQWGYTSIYLFVDAAGNAFKWKTNNFLCTNEGATVHPGARLKVRATIKDHEDYKECKQTVLMRAKVEVIENEVAA